MSDARQKVDGPPITPPEQDLTTREFCGRCHRVSPVGFHARDDIWEAVVGRHWSNSILCIMCFAQMGDEKHVMWERDLKLYAVSYATHHAGRGRSDTSPMEVDRLRGVIREIWLLATVHPFDIAHNANVITRIHGLTADVMEEVVNG